MSGVRVNFDVDAAMTRVLLERAALVETGAAELAKAIRDRIPDTPIPSEPGQPPHSPGPYRDSWKSGQAKRRGMRLTAWAFSMAKASNGEALADILERGTERMEPRPHYRAAVAEVLARYRRMGAR